MFLNLTNSPTAVVHMKEKGLLGVFNKIREKLSVTKDLTDRLFVISNYLEY